MTKTDILDVVAQKGECIISRDEAYDLFPVRTSRVICDKLFRLIPGHSGLWSFAENNSLDVRFTMYGGIVFTKVLA